MKPPVAFLLISQSASLMENLAKRRNQTMEKLPDDLKMEILLRLSVKSILRCKCLSKSWFSLISNPDFTELHFQRSSSSSSSLDGHRVLYKRPAPLQIWSIDINAYFNDDSATIKLDLPLIKSGTATHVNFICSCRGFLLLLALINRRGQLFLWNPSTGHCRSIPDPPRQWVYVLSYGFCYDESTDDYLVVAFHYNVLSGLKSFDIFSVRAHSWQIVDLTSDQLPMITKLSRLRAGCFVNGAIHWLISCADKSRKIIIALDITTKCVRQISTPTDHHSFTNSELAVLGGCLALSSYLMLNINNGTDGQVEIWRMGEHGEKSSSSSWTKLISLSCRESDIYNIFPLCFTKDGEIVATDGDGGLSKWTSGGDDKGELVEYLEFSDYPHCPPWIAYTQTLLSLPC